MEVLKGLVCDFLRTLTPDPISSIRLSLGRGEVEKTAAEVVIAVDPIDVRELILELEGAKLERRPVTLMVDTGGDGAKQAPVTEREEGLPGDGSPDVVCRRGKAKEWISVDEQLPDPHELVLVLRPPRDDGRPWYDLAARGSLGGWGNGATERLEVTHWRHLPRFPHDPEES